MLIVGAGKINSRFNPARKRMAIVEGRDWRRGEDKRTVLVRFQGEERSLTDWAGHLGIAPETLINRFNRAVKGFNESAKNYTVADLLKADYLRKPVVCPLLGLYELALLVPDGDQNLTAKTFLEIASVIRDCNRKHYSRNVCKSCYKLLYQEPVTEDPDHARARQAEFAKTEKGRRTRRDASRRKTLVKLMFSGMTSQKKLLAEIEERYSLTGTEAKQLLESATRLYNAKKAKTEMTPQI